MEVKIASKFTFYHLYGKALGQVTDLVVTFGEVVVQRGGRKKLGAALRQLQCKRNSNSNKYKPK